MKDKLLNKLAIILGFMFIISILTAPMAFITYVWTEDPIALNIGLTALTLIVVYIIAIFIKNN